MAKFNNNFNPWGTSPISAPASAPNPLASLLASFSSPYVATPTPTPSNPFTPAPAPAPAPSNPFTPTPSNPFTPAGVTGAINITPAGGGGSLITKNNQVGQGSSGPGPTTPSTGAFGNSNNALITRGDQVVLPFEGNPAGPLITRDIQGGSTSNDVIVLNPTGPGTGTGPNPGWDDSNDLITRGDQVGGQDNPPYYPETSLMTQRGGTSLQHLNLGLSGMRAAAARGSGVRSPFKQGGGAGGAATDLEKFDNQLLSMGSEYLGKNVAGFAHGGRYNMYNNGGGFYNKAQQMKAAIMDQAMQSGIVAAQLDNVRNANNNNATARDLVGRMRNFARGGRF
jgi:hypothetical protein